MLPKRVLTVLLAALLAAPAVWADSSAPSEPVVVPATSEDNLSGYRGITLEEADSLRSDEKSQFTFGTKVDRLMKIFTHSVYKYREVFLRELLSNAADALEKIRTLSLGKASLLGSAPNLNVTVTIDKERKALIITDYGVGMSYDELKTNLGTIAQSGTAEFLGKLADSGAENKEGDSSSFIGQFGVGFYSVFLVADKVAVASKSYKDDKQWMWVSDGQGTFSIAEDPRGAFLGRGTEITLFIKDDSLEYLEENQIETLVKKYSAFVGFPIYLVKTQTETVELDEPVEEPLEGEETKESDSSEPKVEDEVQDEEEAPKKKTVDRKVRKPALINQNEPIWTRKPSQVTEAEYHDFYKAFAQETSDPLTYIHFRAEGEIDFRAILYIPERAPTNYLQNLQERPKNIKLYVRRVFISDDLEDLFPKYLSFIRGLVDSDDLPLNVSRDTLQHNKMIKLIRKKLVRKALEIIKSLAEDDDKEKYKKFYKEFGAAIKLGIIEDSSNRKKLANLLRFHSSLPASEDASAKDQPNVSLGEYVSRMRKGQSSIYFLSCSSLEECKKSPFTEVLIRRGYEVLYLPDPLDEYMLQNMPEYDGKRFQNVAKDDLKFGDESEDSKKTLEAEQEKFKPLADWFKANLAQFIDKVTVSNRLALSPCALVAGQFGWSGNMERIMQAQAYRNPDDPMAAFYASQKKIFEINPKHPVIEELLRRINDGEGEEESNKELARVLYDAAALRSGYSVQDTAEFGRRIERVVRASLGVDLEKQPEVVVEPAPEIGQEEEEKETSDEGKEESSQEASEGHEEL